MRIFASRTLRAVLLATVTLPWACTAADVPERFVLDQHYKAVRQPQAPADRTKVEVMEVFSYSCPHCFHFEPMVVKWLSTKPSGVVFVRQPWSLGQPAALPRSRAVFAAEQLGVFETFHKALFGAIHGQGKVMATESDLENLFVTSTGLDAQQYRGAYSGFATDNHVRRGENLVRDLGLTSVPNIVVDGRWFINGTTAGGNEKIFDVVGFLISKVKAERKIP